jgi:hypothetical protein
MLAGLNAALVAVGVWAPAPADHLPSVHGMVMVLGFMGTLIALERAQALRQTWAYLAPALLGLRRPRAGRRSPPAGQLLLVEGCLAFALVYLALWRRAPLPLVAVQVLSTVLPRCWPPALWLSVDVPRSAPAAAFLVLTIAAERAELAQLSLGAAPCPGSSGWRPCAGAGRVRHPAVAGSGARSSAWRARHRRLAAARRRRAPHGSHRRAAPLQRGRPAGRLRLAGRRRAGLARRRVPGGDAAYDVVIHAVFLGFGVSMIMAHAPIIFPAVLGRPLPYRPAMWLPLGLLHAAWCSASSATSGRGCPGRSDRWSPCSPCSPSPSTAAFSVVRA